MGGAKVVGLAELSRELRKLDDAGLINEMKQVNFDVASSVIAAASTPSCADLASASAVTDVAVA
jgi:hypothetical protein